MTGDHTTPIIVGDHTFEPVPVIMSVASNARHEYCGDNGAVEGLREIRDNVERFNEIDCGSSNSALGRFSGKEILPILKSFKKVVEAQLLIE